jgi:hypothetical protein
MYKYLYTNSYVDIASFLDEINKENGKIISVTDQDRFTIIYEVVGNRSEI